MVDFILWAFCRFKYSPEINSLEFNKKIPLFKDSTNKKEIIEIPVVTVQYSVNPLQNKVTKGLWQCYHWYSVPFWQSHE